MSVQPGDKVVLDGMVMGDVQATSNSVLELSGMVTGSVTADPGSRVVLSGLVLKSLINLGGVVKIEGFVKEEVVEKKGETEISDKAKVGHLVRKD